MRKSEHAMRTKIPSLCFVLLCLAMSATSYAQTAPEGTQREDCWCLTLKERMRVQAAYKELRIARGELTLYQALDDAQRSLLAHTEQRLQLHMDATRKASTIVDRALAQSLALEKDRAHREALTQAQTRTRRWRNIAIGVAAGAVVATTLSVKISR